jgi:hypothetical protein
VQKVKDAVTVGMTLKSFLAQCHDTGLIEVGGRKREGAPMQEANREFRPIDAVLDVDLPEVERHYPFETKAGQLAYRINLLWGLRPGSDETILYGYYFRSPD